MHTSFLRAGIAGALAFIALLAVPSAATAEPPKPGRDMILVRPTSKTADQVADAIKAYAEQRSWVYLGANKVKKGEVTLVKVCIPAVGQMIWGVGLELSALLPCGNVSVYQKQGRTEISMLDPRYMQLVYPHPDVEKASAAATPELTTMLDAVAR